MKSEIIINTSYACYAISFTYKCYAFHNNITSTFLLRVLTTKNMLCGTHENTTLVCFLNAIMLNEANVAKCDLFTTISLYDIGTTLVKCGVLNNKLAVANLLKCSVPSLAWEGVL